MATRLFEAGAPDVLYIVDLSGYIFRAYHAIAPLSSPTGEPTHAVFGTVNMLERLVRQRGPELLAVAMDSRDNFRKRLYPEYKANRPPQPEDLRAQIRRCRQIVDAYGIPVFQKEGLEADDLIAAAVAQAGARKLRVVIVSADKDLMQLVSDDVLMWDTMRDRVFGPEEVEARFGVPIDRLRDLFALMGDSSDNIPGVPSVGPKTGRDLLLEYESLEGIYEHLSDIQGKKLRENLTSHRDDAFLSRELVTLKADAPVDFDPRALKYGGRDTSLLRKLYTELGFTRHLAALDSEPAGSQRKPAETNASAPAPAYEAILDSETLDRFTAEARASHELALSLELSSDDPLRGEIVGIGLCARPGAGGYIPIRHRYVGAPEQMTFAEVARALEPLLSDESVVKVAHDKKGLLVALQQRKLQLRGASFDTLLAGYLLDAQVPHDLDALARSATPLELIPFDKVTRKSRGRQLGFDEVEVADAVGYSARRADAVLRLSGSLASRLREEGLTEVFEKIEMPLAELLAEMEARGVLVDGARLEKLGSRIEKDLERLERRAHEVVGKDFNVNSPRQLETILFDDLGLKPLKRTKTARSTDAATLEALASQHELPKIILEIRQLSKLKGTYIDALPALIDRATGRIHTRWDQAVAATGRLSSHDPNLQNIPIRSELGRAIRAAFVPPPGHVLLSADYSQIELRVLAHLSEDPVLISAFNSRQDVHTRTAMEIFGVGEDEVTTEHRRRAKAVNFGVIYGQGDSGLARSLGISRSVAGSFIAAYFRRHEGVRRFMNATLEAARAGDSVRTLFGRRRLLPEIRSANRAKRLAAERIAMNMPIQGTAADLLKIAMLALRDPPTPGARMVLTVHDELVFEVPEGEVEQAAERVRRAMENVHELRVPLVVEVRWGSSWAEAH